MDLEPDPAKMIEHNRGDQRGRHADTGKYPGAHLLCKGDAGQGSSDAEQATRPGPPRCSHELIGAGPRFPEKKLNQQDAAQSRKVNGHCGGKGLI